MPRDRYDDEDDRPRRRREDDDDDRPRRRYRDDDDHDRPPPRKSGVGVVFLVLGIVGVVVVVAGVGLFLLLMPAITRVREASARMQASNNVQRSVPRPGDHSSFSSDRNAAGRSMCTPFGSRPRSLDALKAHWSRRYARILRIAA